METIIYTLSDPRTGEVRYIGKTKRSLKYRLAQHLRESLKPSGSTKKKNWIRQLIYINLLPVIEELDCISPINEWQSVEQYWIAQFKSWGFNLTNMTTGGDGNQNQIMSPEAHIKRSQSLKGKPRPEEVRKKISESHKGKIISKDTREKLRLRNLGKKYSEDTKKKRYKPVLLVDQSGEFIEEYPSLQHAALAHNCRRGAISNVCSGRTKTACGLYWKFKS